MTGKVQADDIDYVPVRVPASSSSLRITIFLDRIKTTRGEVIPRPVVLVKKNGLPTTGSYDDKFALPSPPYALDIFDDTPEAGTVVYLGIWGGEVLNSLYWFAGEAQEIFYSIDVETESCGPRTTCGPVLQLLGLSRGGALSMALLPSEAPLELAVVLPPGLEQAAVRMFDLAASFRGLSAACIPGALFEARLFMSQPDEAGAVAAAVPSCSTDDFSLVLPFPRAGIWTLTLRLSSPADAANSSAHSAARSAAARRGLQARTVPLRDAKAPRDLAKGGTGGPTLAPVVAAASAALQAGWSSIRINASYVACPWGTTTGTTKQQHNNPLSAAAASVACSVPVVPLVSERNLQAPPSTVLLLSQDTPLEASKLAEVVFTADLQSSQAAALAGGAVVVQLRVHLGEGGAGGGPESGASRAAVYARLRSLGVRVSVRCGAMAGPADTEGEGQGALILPGQRAVVVEEEDARSALDKGPPRPADVAPAGGASSALSRLGQVLGVGRSVPSPPPTPHHERQQHQQRQLAQGADEDDDDGGTDAYPGLLLVWTVDKPVLPGLFDGPLFVRVSGSGDGSDRLVVSLTVVAQACSEEGCSGHGQCVEHAGAVPFSGCACSYPYAGAHCESLALPWAERRLQAAMLIGSNLAMAFAVALCASCNMKVVAMVLALSAASSMAYHACDLGLYCFSQSFRALQTLDIAFSTLSVATLILHYSPGNAETHATMMVLVLGLLLAPIATQPTATVNLVGAVVLACLLSLSVWLYALRGALAAAGGWCIRGRRASLLELVSTNSRFRPLSGAEEDGADAEKDYRDEREDRGEEGEGGDLDELLHSAAVGGDEGEWRTTPVSNAHGRAQGAPASNAAQRCRQLWRLASSLSWSLLGAALAAAGIAFFALQTRLNYHVNHALWHGLVMLSAYPLVRGRGAVMHASCGLLGIAILGPAAKKRPGY